MSSSFNLLSINNFFYNFFYLKKNTKEEKTFPLKSISQWNQQRLWRRTPKMVEIWYTTTTRWVKCWTQPRTVIMIINNSKTWWQHLEWWFSSFYINNCTYKKNERNRNREKEGKLKEKIHNTNLTFFCLNSTKYILYYSFMSQIIRWWTFFPYELLNVFMSQMSIFYILWRKWRERNIKNRSFNINELWLIWIKCDD